MRCTQQEGLQHAYNEQSLDIPAVRQWLRQTMPMTHGTSRRRHQMYTRTWSLVNKTQAWASHFDTNWINGQFSPAMWSHFDHVGPRTTNLAEGHHNGVNNRFGMPHPSLHSFVAWLQKNQYEVQCRVIQLGRPSCCLQGLEVVHYWIIELFLYIGLSTVNRRL